MIETEQHLAALAYELIGTGVPLTKNEYALVSHKISFPQHLLTEIGTSIRAGEDPLGEAFSRIRTSIKRRDQGATYTPKVIVDAMVGWAVNQGITPIRIVDPGAGSGRFILATAKAFPKSKLLAIEVDPLATLMLRANAAVLGLSNRLTIAQSDYRVTELSKVDGPTLFIGNPPYVRHHDIGQHWKEWLAETARKLGFAASRLAGLHIHFFVRTRQIASPGDFGAFITAAEWIDVNYGSVLRQMLANGLGGTAVHLIDAKALPFSDAFTTGAITCFHVGNRPNQFIVRTVDSLAKLAPLAAGESIEWRDLEAAPRWSILLRKSRRPEAGEIELGELFRVHRGQVTGCNAAWIAGENASRLPDRFLFPSVTKARELIAADDNLDGAAHLRRVIDLPIDLDELSTTERKQVAIFLRWTQSIGAHRSYIATHRRAWWSVGLKQAAPILCTYMARRAPAFVRNYAQARHLNIAHGLYPLEPMSDTNLDIIARYLRATVCMSDGRTYAGGLVKFEPSEVARLHIPEPSAFHTLA